jgi:uncharacterized protein (TIGR02466 family)
MNATVVPLFSKVFYLKKLNLNTNKIIDLIDLNFHKSGSKNMSNIKDISLQSNVKSVLNQKKFKYLKDILIKEFNIYNNEVLHYSNEFKITTSWFTKSLTDQKSDYHNHCNSMISGILYLNTDEKSGGVSFENFENVRFKLIPKKYNIYNCLEYTFKPSNGLLMFFPSEVYHKILNNNSNIIRYSLAFNLIPVGPIGDKNSDSFINIQIK